MQKIARKKYKIDGGIYQLHSTVNYSPCWADPIKIKDLYLKGKKMMVGNGKQTDFWGHKWCSDKPLLSTFPDLFE